MQEVEGSTPTGGTYPNDFSDPIDQDIRTQRALSWKIVVSEWRSVIAVWLNVGGGVRFIKPAKLYMCTPNTTRTDAWHRVCVAMVPYPWATWGTLLRELEYTHTYLDNSDCCIEGWGVGFVEGVVGLGWGRGWISVNNILLVQVLL